MDIKNELLEGSCNKFGNSFLNYFNWNDIDISLTRVDIKNKKVNVISSNYEWVLICWGDDLDLLIGERLRSGLQYWNDYSDAYNKTLSKLNENKFKIDFCTKYLDSYEIFSINSKKIFQ